MVDLKLIRQLVRLMNNGGVNELELEDKEEGLSLKLRRQLEGVPAAAQPAPVVLVGGGGMPAAPAQAGGAPAPAVIPDGPPPGTEQILSPMVGTFYRTPSPDAAPFVEVGSRVEEETVVCIVEAMKVMNELKAEMRGEVLEILVENGEPVEFGQPLLLVKKG